MESSFVHIEATHAFGGGGSGGNGGGGESISRYTCSKRPRNVYRGAFRIGNAVGISGEFVAARRSSREEPWRK